MRKPGAHALTILAAATVATAAPLARAEVVRPGESPGLGLGLTGGEVPSILKKAKADPYAAPPAPACESIPKEIAALDAVLGPDADAPPQARKTSDQAGRLLTNAMRSMIPHRDIVRFITGAGRKDKARNDAAMAGWSRRGYLKGMEVNLGCAEREAGAQPSGEIQTSAPAPQASPQAAPAGGLQSAAAQAPAPPTAVEEVPAQSVAVRAAPPAPVVAGGSRVLVDAMAPDAPAASFAR